MTSIVAFLSVWIIRIALVALIFFIVYNEYDLCRCTTITITERDESGQAVRWRHRTMNFVDWCKQTFAKKNRWRGILATLMFLCLITITIFWWIA